MTEVVVFLVAAAIALVGALGVVASKNPVHSALFLIQTLMGVAVLFVLQEAHFLAAVQVVVYAGAIVILFLFVIMLLGVDKAEEFDVDPIAGQRPLAAVLGGTLLAIGLTVMIVAVDGSTGSSATFDPQTGQPAETALDSIGADGQPVTDIERIGRVLFSDYALAFEITAALLTIAVIGAVVLTRSVSRGARLEDLEPASFDLPPVAPRDKQPGHDAAGESGA